MYKRQFGRSVSPACTNEAQRQKNVEKLKRLISLTKGCGAKVYVIHASFEPCLLYTSDAADDLLCGDLGGRRMIKKKKKNTKTTKRTPISQLVHRSREYSTEDESKKS